MLITIDRSLKGTKSLVSATASLVIAYCAYVSASDVSDCSSACCRHPPLTCQLEERSHVQTCLCVSIPRSRVRKRERTLQKAVSLSSCSAILVMLPAPMSSPNDLLQPTHGSYGRCNSGLDHMLQRDVCIVCSVLQWLSLRVVSHRS